MTCVDPADRLTTEFGRLSVTEDGGLVAVLVRADRTDHPDEGLANPKNLGFVPTEVLIARSSDAGRTWTDPVPVEPGDFVKVFDGPFAGIEGIFKERKGENRALLMMEMLGTESTVEVDSMLLRAV